MNKRQKKYLTNKCKDCGKTCCDVSIRCKKCANIKVNKMKKFNFSKKLLEKEYILNRKSLKQIAKKLNCSSATIANYLKLYNIKTRTSWEGSEYKSKKCKYCKGEFISVYKQQKYCSDICARYDWRKNNIDKIRKQQREFANKNYSKYKIRIQKYGKNFRKKYPWIVTFKNINQRCNNPNNSHFKYYGGRGIKNRLTIKDLKFLWFKNKAYLMKCPSIHRINNDKDYTLKNCEYIELSKNISYRNIINNIKRLKRRILKFNAIS